MKIGDEEFSDPLEVSWSSAWLITYRVINPETGNPYVGHMFHHKSDSEGFRKTDIEKICKHVGAAFNVEPISVVITFVMELEQE